MKEVAEKHSHLPHVEDSLEERYSCIMDNERARSGLRRNKFIIEKFLYQNDYSHPLDYNYTFKFNYKYTYMTKQISNRYMNSSYVERSFN